MSSVKGMEKLSIEVDADQYRVPVAGQPDPVVPFLQKLSEVVHDLGGAIPGIVNNSLSLADDWDSKLLELVKNPLNDGEDEDTSLTRTIDVLLGKKIRIFDNPAPHVSGNAEGNAEWSLESGEFTSGKSYPNMDNAVLYIYVSDLDGAVASFGQDSMELFSLGRIRTLIHELVHGMRIMKMLVAHLMTLTWSQNQHQDWCIEKNQFLSKIITPPKLGPNPTFARSNTSNPADAGRTWEHSITGGKAFFQENLKVVTSVGGKFYIKKLSKAQAIQVFAQPSALIEISRRLADEVATAEAGAIDMHPTNSGLVLDFEYQCHSAGGWIAEHRDQDNSWRTVSGTEGKDGLIEPQPGNTSGGP
uniref:Uncharacterized protein n=1 Tax=Cryptomonas curvata TaxID=233186 RepID=A0A7S0QH27_9CRYP|mmetsp:Transcript_27899/g.58030  ORF Transcript_27899/g.58030 Transcript_27899/m.58030 type:complete len:359 (+) Transcript_27899:258-1334(+)